MNAFKKYFRFLVQRAVLMSVILFTPARVAGAQNRLAAQSALIPSEPWRLDVSAAVLKRPADERLFSLPELGLTYAVERKVELSGFWPFLILDRAGRSTLAGSGDIELSAKAALYPAKGWAAAFRFRVKLPNAKDEKRLGTNQTDFFASLIVSERAGLWEFSQNLGLGFLDNPTGLRSQEDVYTFAVLTSFHPGGWSFEGEWSGQASHSPAYVFSNLSAGVGYRFGKLAFRLSALKSLTEKAKGFENLLGADWGAEFGLQWFPK